MKKLVVSAIATVIIAGTMSAAEVDWRQRNQQQRIAQGVGSGQLTAGETARIEGQEYGVRNEIRTDRAMNGGHLTAGEWRQVNRQENRMSNEIYRYKHNRFHQ